MKTYEVSVTKVFGLAITNTAIIEAKNQYVARDKALDSGSYTEPSWEELYNAVTQDEFSDSYEIAKITVDGKVIEDKFFSHHLLREAVEQNDEGGQG